MKTQPVFKSEAGRLLIIEFYERMLLTCSYFQKSFIQTSFGNTFVASAGDPGNPPLILLHGSGSNSLSWTGEAGKLSETHRIYCLDIPGEPGMSEPRRFTTAEDFSSWLNEIIDTLQLARPLLAGLSLGGWAALCYAMNYPDKACGVVALAPTGIVKPRFSFLPKVLFYSIQGEKGIRKLMKVMSGGKQLSEDVTSFQLLVNSHCNLRSDIPPLFTDEQIRRLEIPVTYVCGKDDFVFDGAKAVQRLNRINPGIRTFLTDAGHILTDISAYLDRDQTDTAF